MTQDIHQAAPDAQAPAGDADPATPEVRKDPDQPGSFEGPKGDPAEGKVDLEDQGEIAADDAGATAAAQRATGASNEDDMER